MKFLYIITELNQGGAENAFFQVVRGVRATGHEVLVVCLYDGDGPIGQALRAEGIEVIDLGIRELGSFWKGARLRGIVRNFQPDRVHSWLFHANLLARLFVPRSVPLICSLRVAEPRPLHIWLDRLTRCRVQHVLCVSKAVAAFAKQHLKVRSDKVSVIENGVDADFFAEALTATRSRERLIGLCVARVTEQKGLDILIHALANLPADLPWEWHMAGDEPEPDYANDLKELAESLGISSRIHWHGAVPRKNLVPFYAKATVYGLPSRWEGQPNVVLEAMASGLPVLAARTDGIDDLLQDTPGCLKMVDPNTPDAWTNALVDFWQNPSLADQLTAAGQMAVRARTWQQAVAKHLDVYKAR